MEEWREVPGSNGKYQVSISTKEGKCRSLNFRNTGKTCELSNIPTKNNRIFWHLSNDGDVLTRQAAKWIAITYPDLVENDYFEGALIDHKDRDRMNNHPSSLRWVTHQESLKNRDLS